MKVQCEASLVELLSSNTGRRLPRINMAGSRNSYLYRVRVPATLFERVKCHASIQPATNM